MAAARWRFTALLVLSSLAPWTDALKTRSPLRARRTFAAQVFDTNVPSTPIHRRRRMPPQLLHQRAPAASAQLLAACAVWSAHASPGAAFEVQPLTWLAASSFSSSVSEPIGLAGVLALALGSLVLALNSRDGSSSSDGRSVGAEASAEASATSDAGQLRADVARLTAEATALKAQLRAVTTPADAAAATLGSLAAASPSPRPRSRDAEALRLGVAVARLEAQLAVAQAAREDADAALATYRWNAPLPREPVVAYLLMVSVLCFGM